LSFCHESIIASAVSGGLVLTANKRLARHLVATYDQQMRAKGRQAWGSPQIVSVDAWLYRCLAELGEDWRLLEGAPALRLWEQLIEKSSAGTELELLQVAATARKAYQAHQWSVTYDCQLSTYPLTEDQKIFSQWQQSYNKMLRQRDWIDKSEVPAFICQAISDGRLQVPETVMLAGFDQWSPELDALGKAIQAAGSSFEEIKPVIEPSSRQFLYPCTDPEAEMQLAARWARELLEKGATSIGIVVADLQARRKAIERAFRRQIDPSADLALQEQESRFSLSLGAPLLDQGPVYAALEILATGFRLGIEQASYLLRTPYLGGSQSEADKRSVLDRRLRSYRQQTFSLKGLAEQALQEQRAELIGQMFNALHGSLGDSKKRLPGEWAGYFSQQLQAVGWPGERSLSSAEYQMVKAWQEKLLPALASLDQVAEPIERSQAVGLLRRLAGEIDFQLEAPTGSVQVVGLLESVGLSFDHLWVMGLNEDTFPAAARPNPFLPIGIQIEKGMPHASAQRELDFSRNVLLRLKAASPAVIFSYPQRSGDCELRPSPLIQDLPVASPDFSARQDAVARQAATDMVMDELCDLQGPRLAAELAEGGTAILKDQALCPFRAFAHFRLRASAFEQAQPGLDPMVRGSLLHKVLEYFWREVGSQQKLLEMSADDRQQRLETQVDSAVNEYFSEPGAAAGRLLSLEKERLLALATEWLAEVEEGRTKFQVVALEEECFEQVGPLKIRICIDRIDQLADGSRVVIDYKTGLVREDSLLAERLLEPQLPIYAIANQQGAVDGVAFAQVRRGNCKMVGVARDGELLPKVSGLAGSKLAQQLALSNWPELLDLWKGQLEQLATDYVEGKAAVSPVDVEIACRYCDLRGFCRLSEARPQTVAGGEQE